MANFFVHGLRIQGPIRRVFEHGTGSFTRSANVEIGRRKRRLRRTDQVAEETRRDFQGAGRDPREFGCSQDARHFWTAQLEFGMR